MAAPTIRGAFATHNATTLSSLIWDPVTASGAEWPTWSKIIDKSNFSGVFSNPCGLSPLDTAYKPLTTCLLGQKVILSTIYAGSLVFDWAFRELDFTAGVYVNLCWMMVEHDKILIWDSECQTAYERLPKKPNTSKITDDPPIADLNTRQRATYNTILERITA